MELLRDHRERQQVEEQLAGVVYRRGGYVFSTEDGTPYHPKFFTDRFRELCVAIGVPVIVLHDARHSSAPLEPTTACPSTRCSAASGMLNPRTTEETYVHVLSDAERRAAKIMGEAILGRVVYLRHPRGAAVLRRGKSVGESLI